jgi:hypothetical protein
VTRTPPFLRALPSAPAARAAVAPHVRLTPSRGRLFRALVVVAASGFVAVAAPSSAEPERNVTLTPSQRTASWHSDFRVGPYLGESIGCDRDALGCETTLIRLTRAGTLSVATTQALPTHAVDGRLILELFRSDANGATGKPVTVNEQRSGATASISAPSLTAGYYLLEVTWYDAALGKYTGRATYLPK